MFELHPRLVADCHELGRCGAVRMLLQRNASLPWFVLVPETAALELHELPAGSRLALVTLTDAVARFVKQRFCCDKLNVAAIGNRVPQLHVHVVGRRVDDCCWPDVVWGRELPPAAYTDPELQSVTAALVATCCHAPGVPASPAS